MVDYEKGSPAWDIGMVLTRHGGGCTRKTALQESAMRGYAPGDRLAQALKVHCSCGVGDSESESTSLR